MRNITTTTPRIMHEEYKNQATHKIKKITSCKLKPKEINIYDMLGICKCVGFMLAYTSEVHG